MDLISKLRPTKKAAPDPNAHHSLDGDEDVPEEYLHPCCQKELQADRKKNFVLGKLREGDRARIALEQRRTALGLTSLPTENEHVHQHGSACCGLMTDYPALQEARAARQTTAFRSVDEEEDGAPPSVRLGQGRGEESEDEDEDEEDEELLRELEGGAGELMELQRAEMMRRALEYDELRRLGIGFHVEASSSDVLHLVHLRSTLVCHLYDPFSPTCASIDLALEALAPRYPGTRCCRLPLKKAGELETRLRLPTGVPALLVVIVDGCVVDSCGDFRRFGTEHMVHDDALEQWLSYGHALIREPPSLARAREYVRKSAKAVSGLLRRGDGKGELDDEDEEEYYECGLEGCRKTFAHDHIGLTELPTALRGS